MQRRMGTRSLGFSSITAQQEAALKPEQMMKALAPEDLIRFGMIPEFVGRLPIICPLMPLDSDALVRIMTEPRNALVKQYKRFFEMEGSDIEFQPEALVEIARLAKEKDTGARGLRSIVEDLMLDIMYELPDRPDDQKGVFIVTPEVVRGDTKLFDVRPLPVDTPPPADPTPPSTTAESEEQPTPAPRKKESA